MSGRRFDRRKIEEGFFLALMLAAVAIVVGSLLLIVGTVLVRGFPSLSFSMVTQTPKGGYYLGKEGGVLNAILGSLYLAAGATGLALLVALPVVCYMNVFVSRDTFMARLTRLVMDVLWGIPSIVYGAFGFMLMLWVGMRASLGAAMIAVALFELPILVRAMDEVVRLVPRELHEAAYSLGATRLETALGVVARQAFPGIVTAALMAFGRGIGDTACVLFTAGFTDRVPTSLAQPAATLPLAIFFQLGTPFPEVQGRAYASAAILTLTVLGISLLARFASRHISRHIIH